MAKPRQFDNCGYTLLNAAFYGVPQMRERMVDGLPSADPFAGHGISPLAQSRDRCPRRVRKPSRRLGQIDDGCAVGSPQQVDHQRQLAAVSRNGRRGVSADVSLTDAILRLPEPVVGPAFRKHRSLFRARDRRRQGVLLNAGLQWLDRRMLSLSPSGTPRSIPAGNQRPPRAAPVGRGLRVQQGRRLLHLRDIVGRPDLLELLIGRGIADIGAIAPGGVGVDVDAAVLPLGVGDRVLRQRLKLGGLLLRVRPIELEDCIITVRRLFRYFEKVKTIKAAFRWNAF